MLLFDIDVVFACVGDTQFGHFLPSTSYSRFSCRSSFGVNGDVAEMIASQMCFTMIFQQIFCWFHALDVPVYRRVKC